eukprot:Phypoly_transcript_04959.p1 GENE.Phypoly_transcript_04959~~Phypoly_transcript_04959.p1  ORF type:complete len:625 (-),score=55.40 Phypoly_transcript_04959:55-1929(-)
MDTKHAGRSILRRSSVVLQRRYSRSDNSLEEFQAQQQQSIWNAAAAARRSSVQQLSTDSPQPRRASIAVPFPRRSSIAATAKKTKDFVGSLPKSSGIPYRYLQVQAPERADQHQHDYKSLKGIDSLRDSQDMLSDLDISSNCSEISELFDEVDCTDPCDWFLDEEMEDEPMFEILERPDLISRMREAVNNIASQLNISPGDAVLVLQYFNWKTDDLLHDYFDKPEYYLSKAGVMDRTKSGQLSEPSQCNVCLDEKPANEFYALGCAHSYCRDCWKEYLQGLALTEGAAVTQTSCMYPKCTAKLTEKDFEELALPSTLQRYMYFLLKEYSEKELHSVFCPNPACGNAVVYSGTGRPTDVVECHCGTRFCFSCGHEKHNPVSCDRLLEWLALLQDDSESLGFIKATSKPCFHCGTFTERISGCNHMICRRGTGGCGGEWCWMCRKDWASHGPHTGGFYSCNKYEESEAKVIDDQAQEFLNTKNESKFLHYYNRYFNHDVLMKDVMKYLNSGDVEATMGEYSKMTNSDPEFFLEAAELLVECRRVLKYTYVYGYYMEDSHCKALFEYQQASAEGITERLSELFHTPVDVIAKSPLEFVNYVRVTKKFISNLVKSIEEGFTSEMDIQH